MKNQPKKLLTIGGWDPCGAYGIPADLKTFTALNCYGMGVMTVVTAQNSVGWYGAEFLSADFVAQQLDAVLGDYGAHAVKTGFLGKVDLIEAIADKLAEYAVPNVVIDPVAVNARGDLMFPPEVTDAYFERLFPLATTITPNRFEFNVLISGETDPWELTEKSGDEALKFVDRLKAKGEGAGPAIVVKGIRQKDGLLADGLIADGKIELFPHAKIETRNVSGTGDSFSAALCCQLAHGDDLPNAVAQASACTAAAIEQSADWRLAGGPNGINHFAMRKSD